MPFQPLLHIILRMKMSNLQSFFENSYSLFSISIKLLFFVSFFSPVPVKVRSFTRRTLSHFICLIFSSLLIIICDVDRLPFFYIPFPHSNEHFINSFPVFISERYSLNYVIVYNTVAMEIFEIQQKNFSNR